MLLSTAAFAEGDTPVTPEPETPVESTVGTTDSFGEESEPELLPSGETSNESAMVDIQMDGSTEVDPLDAIGDETELSEIDNLTSADTPETTQNENDLGTEGETTNIGDVVLVDGTGEPLDMASQESADTISGGDPWWISGGVKYAVVFSDQSCPLGTSEAAGTCWKVTENAISTALEKIDMLNLLPTNGMVVVENGNYAENVVIDGLDGNGVLKSLKGILGMGSNMSTITGNITISNTIAGFTLKGFTIDGGVMVAGNTGALVLQDLYITNANGDGLVVENHTGTVELNSVQSRNNQGDGGRINNSSSPTGYVKVTNSAFDYNDDGNASTWNSGLKIITNGPVTLEGVATSRNNGNGAEIYGFSQLTINNSLFDNNNPSPYAQSGEYGYGLFAESAKPAKVLINNVFAYFNGNNGLEIRTAGTIQMNYVRGSHSSIRTGQINPTGETVQERLSEDNKYIGDRWYFSGSNGQELDIYLSSIVFDAYLELRDASDDSLLASNDNLSPGSTNSQIEYTLTTDGLYYIVVKILESTTGVDGSYTLSLNDPLNEHITKYNLKGASLNVTSGGGLVKVTNTMFQDNVGDGLVIKSLGVIYLSTVDASHNSMRGAVLDNCQYDETSATCLGIGSVTITSLSGAGWYGGNYFLDNGSTGLEVKTKGAIVLTNVGAYDNLGTGVDLRNDFGTSAITINTNVTNFTNVFRNNGLDGLKITSMGTVKVENSEANFNKGYGYFLTTRGTVALKNLTGSSNGLSGLYVNNQVTGSLGNVSITSAKNVRNAFKENGNNEPGTYPGIDIRSFGNISVVNTDAMLNFAAGAHLTSKDAPSAKTITLTDVNTSENQGSGVLAYAKGAINVKGLISSNNSLTGSDIVYTGETVYERLTANNAFDNWWFTAPPATHVNIILQSKEFNAYLELYDAYGNLVAWDDNSYEDNDAQISIDLPSEGTFYIHVMSADLNKGNYTLSVNDPANLYGGTYFYFYGALLDNCDWDSVNQVCRGNGNVTINPTSITPINIFNDNNYRGIEVRTKGAILASNLNAVDNGNTGAYLFNPNGIGAISVISNHKNLLGAFDKNTGYGIYAVSARAITLRNISAVLNGEAGAYLNNCLVANNACLGSGGITLSSANGLVNTFSSNQKFGLWISTSGSVNLADIHGNANGLNGLYVKNAYLGAVGNVNIKASKNVTNTFFTNVWGSPSYLAGVFDPKFYGVEIYSNGVINLRNIDVQTTYGTGAWIRNDGLYAITPKNLTIQDGTFEANQGYGLVAYSNGSINLFGVNARFNSLVSGSIDPWGETVFEHLAPNTPADVWWFDGDENDEVDIILVSDEFDVILEVFDKNNNLIAADDDSYTGTNARVTFTLPADGDYYIKVRQHGIGDGNYKLSLNDEYMNWVTLYEYTGAYVDNRNGIGGVTVKSTTTNGTPSFYHNNFNGLTIRSSGSVTLSNVHALQNGADGANISNHARTNSVTVNTTGISLTSSFSYNTKFGLFIQSRGLVVIKNSGRMYMRDNGYSGAYIDNRTYFASAVNISRVEVNNNIMKGIEIHSTGNVVLNNILAIHNLENGVYVDNCDWDDELSVCNGIGNVTLSGSLGANTISDNGATGLAVYSNGGISVNKLFAIQNGGRGMVLSNETGTGFVTITNTIARLNDWHGIHVETKGAVTVNYVHSMSNGMGNDADGIYLRTANPTQVIFQNSSFLGNEGSGIEIAYDTLGMPLLINVSYFGNDTDMDGDLNFYVHPNIP